MLKNIPIRLKMVLMYLNMLFFTLVIIFTVLYQAQQMNAELVYLRDGAMGGSQAAMSMKIHLLEERLYYSEALGNIGDPDKLNSSLAGLAAAQGKFTEALGSYQQSIANENTMGKSPSGAIATAYQSEYTSALNEYVGLLRAGDAQGAQTALAGVHEQSGKVDSSLDAVVSGCNALTSAAVESGKGILTFLYWFFLILAAVYLGVTLLVGRKLAYDIAIPLQGLTAAASNMARGDVEVELGEESRDEVGLLTKEFRIMAESVRQQAEVLSDMAEGNYSETIPVRSDNDLINTAIVNMLDSSNEMLAQIRETSGNVSLGAQQIAQSAQSLAEGSTEQAAAIEELTATVSEVMGKAENNAQFAQQVLELTQKTGEKMGESMSSMEQMRTAMKVIDESSKNIASVIDVINDIAFQTGILALNAAVEAAHAGQFGQSFAVVANEVRTLAAKSAQAAEQTTDIIELSAQRVKEGNRLVEETYGNLQEVGRYASQNLDLSRVITENSREQSVTIASLNDRISQISEVVQGNTANAQESAAAAQSMADQATTLDETVSRYRLREDALDAPKARRSLASVNPQYAAKKAATSYGKY